MYNLLVTDSFHLDVETNLNQYKELIALRMVNTKICFEFDHIIRDLNAFTFNANTSIWVSKSWSEKETWYIMILDEDFKRNWR